MQWSNKVMRWPGRRLNCSITRFCWAWIIVNESLSSVARNKVDSGFFWSNRVTLSILAEVTSISSLSQRTWLTSMFRLNLWMRYSFLQRVGVFGGKSRHVSGVYDSWRASRVVLFDVHLSKSLLVLFAQILESAVGFKFRNLSYGAMFTSLIYKLFVVGTGLSLLLLCLALGRWNQNLIRGSDRLFRTAIWQ